MFLHTHGCFPRLSKGMIIVPYKPNDRKSPTLWKCLYFSPYMSYRSALVTTIYTPPVQGGKLRLREHANLLKEFPKFVDFFKEKVTLMMLIEKINADLKKPIVKEKIEMLKKKMQKRTWVQAASDCTHTLVTHRVGYHYDVFCKHSCGIENKVLIPAEGKGGKKDGSCPPLGRGGGGSGVFTYCILDW